MTVLDQFSLDGETAIVTGSSRGIGRALAEALAEAGANVCIVSRDERDGERAADEIAAETGVETLAVPADVTDESSVEAMGEATLDEFGSIDVLVNNAGIARTAPAHEMSLETWNEVLQTNLTGVFLCTKHAGGTMVDGDGGTVINMASMSAFVANYPQEEVVYHASKGGVVSFTRQLLGVGAIRCQGQRHGAGVHPNGDDRRTARGQPRHGGGVALGNAHGGDGATG